MVAWCRRRRAGNAGIVRALFNRQDVAIAGRDGTLAQTGGTGSTALHPTYGSVQSSGALISHSLAIPGAGTLPMSFAQGARTNLCIRSQEIDNAAWAKSAVGGGTTPALISNTVIAPDGTATAESYTFLAPVSGDQSRIIGTAMTVVASSVYTASVWLKAATSADVGKIIHLRHVAASGYTAVTLTDLWVRAVITETAFSTSHSLEISQRPSVGSSTGTINVAIWGAQVELGTFPGLYIPTTTTALTRAADNILWTPPSALSTTSGEVVAIATPYLWSAGAGSNGPMAAATIWFNRSSNITLYRDTTDIASRNDSAGARTVTGASLAVDSGVLFNRSVAWSATANGYRNGGTYGTPVAIVTPPWVSAADVRIGRAYGADTQHAYGFVGLIYVPGGLTDAERIALASVTGGSLTYVG